LTDKGRKGTKRLPRVKAAFKRSNDESDRSHEGFF